MTRINTNVSSLIAQKTLSRSNAGLQESLTRLSTGLRINSGKDDPAGLIASEALRSDIISVRKAITNTERANQLIGTADSALGQVSALLNDIRGLVSEAANTGAQSDDQIAANQLQIDSSLEAIDRIAQTTSFQGKRLLDGNLGFITAGVPSNVKGLQIDQANLGTAGSLAIEVDITAAATQATITNTGGINFVAGDEASGTITFSDITTPEEQATSEDITTTGSDLTDRANIVGGLTVKSTSAFAGEAGNDLQIVFAEDNAVATHSASLAGNTLTITVGTQGAGATIALADIITGLAGDADFTDNLDSNISAGNYTVGDDDGAVIDFAGGVDQESVDDVITITSLNGGTAFNGNLTFGTSGTVAAGEVSVVVTGANIAILVNDSHTYDLADLADLINTELESAGYSAELTATAGDGEFDSSSDPAVAANLTGGTNDSGTGLAADIVLEITGTTGSEVFSFQAGSTLAQVISAINLVSDSTGVEASNVNGNLSLLSTQYGSKAYVDVNVIQEGTGGLFGDGLSANRETGTDIAAKVNGVKANGDGNTLSINTSTLDLTLTVDDGDDTDVTFTITGGGALFQLGPDVVSNQQARLGIQSVNTARLGGISGKLFQLRSGGSASLATDISTAAKIVDETITQVTSLRGRLGAFQRTTLETNIFTLNDTLANLTDAESAIRDADFAAESASLTRAQILVQSGTAVLSIANSNPQNVLSLLR